MYARVETAARLLSCGDGDGGGGGDGDDDGFGTASATSSVTVEREDLCGAPANSFGYRELGYTHSATLTDITPGEVIYYRLCSDKEV